MIYSINEGVTMQCVAAGCGEEAFNMILRDGVAPVWAPWRPVAALREPVCDGHAGGVAAFKGAVLVTGLDPWQSSHGGLWYCATPCESSFATGESEVEAAENAARMYIP